MTPKEILKEIQDTKLGFNFIDMDERTSYKHERVFSFKDERFYELRQALTELEELKQEVIARQETENSLTQWAADLTTELEELKRYPTADEVCEAMSEYYGVEVIYRKTDGFQLFRSRWNDGEYGDIYLEELIKTPHLITLIGRFYEGLEKVGKKDV